MTRNHKCNVIQCRARGDTRYVHTNVTCANYKESHYATSTICPARKQAISLADSGKDE